jgi:hypothetical protein
LERLKSKKHARVAKSPELLSGEGKQSIKLMTNLTTIVTEGELIFTEHLLDTKEDEAE